jgi:hypothetical protein
MGRVEPTMTLTGINFLVQRIKERRGIRIYWSITPGEIWVVLFMNSGSKITYSSVFATCGYLHLVLSLTAHSESRYDTIIEGFGIPKNLVGEYLNVWQRD